MASYNTSTSAAQEAALDFVLVKVNANRAIDNLPPITKAQFFADSVQDFLGRCLSQFRESRDGDLKTAYNNAPTNTQNQVKALLGLS